jgi:hypothetical protein
MSKKVDVKLFNENDTPYGKSLRQWSNRWWNWMVGQPSITNPTEDHDGNFANNCQTYDNVYFLCGTTKTDTIKRKCTVPDGKSILLPVICFEHSLIEDPSIKNPHELLELATKDLKDYDNDKVFATINETEYTTRSGIIRIRSPHFTITLPEGNVWGKSDGFTFAAADGYWIFIRDLEPGSYNLSVRAQPTPGATNSLKIDTSYTVKVDH